MVSACFRPYRSLKLQSMLFKTHSTTDANSLLLQGTRKLASLALPYEVMDVLVFWMAVLSQMFGKKNNELVEDEGGGTDGDESDDANVKP